MTEVFKVLGMGDISDIIVKIEWRQQNFKESLQTSVAVVLVNLGSQYIQLRCTNGEWIGEKRDLPGNGGIPRCPNGHPLLELSEAPVLALVSRKENDG